MDLSINIFGQKQSGVFSNRDEKSDSYSKTNSKIHCIHSIVISLFRILIDFKDIKFTKQVYEELNCIENANITERKILLEKLVDKFGLYVPLELLIGGRINMSFDANNEDEKKQDFSKWDFSKWDFQTNWDFYELRRIRFNSFLMIMPKKMIQ